MTDATHVHTPAHHDHSHRDHVAPGGSSRTAGHFEADSPRPSLLEASAAARLSSVAGVAAALWAGVYWALH